ncbi:MAG: ABC transporter permease, partial [Geodermatophilaceae bacterium]|nr:ABC transporter permease [Geodermatophilaceae bacterium]
MSVTTAQRSGQLPSLVTVSAARIRAELLSFFRERAAVVFVLLFPILLLFIFGAVFGGNDDIA